MCRKLTLKAWEADMASESITVDFGFIVLVAFVIVVVVFMAFIGQVCDILFCFVLFSLKATHCLGKGVSRIATWVCRLILKLKLFPTQF